MANKQQVTETSKIIKHLKTSSLLIQFTFVAFPLTMYIVYNKTIISKNPNATIIILLFLLFILLSQLIFRTFATIYENIIKTKIEIKSNSNYLKNLITKKTKPGINNIYDISTSSRVSNQITQKHIAKSNTLLLIIYFILITTIGGFLVIVPAIFFSINYLVAKKNNIKYIYAINNLDKYASNKNDFIKNIFSNILYIKGSNLDKSIIQQYELINNKVNYYKTSALYLKNILMKYSMAVNIINIAMIVILGRFLYSLELLSIYHITTCSLLTMWVSRSIAQIFINLDAANQSINDIYSKNINKTIYTDTDTNINQTNNTNSYITTENANKLITELENNSIVFISNEANLNLKLLPNMFAHENIKAGYINNKFNIFYGSILNNITLFDQNKHYIAEKILKQLNLDYIINKLPYQYNYVTTGIKDEALCYNLKLGINITRELLNNINILILDLNIEELDKIIKKGLIDYCKNNNIKIIIKNSNINFNKIKTNTNINNKKSAEI